MTELFCDFTRALFSRNSAFAKFRENESQATISEFTVNKHFECKNVIFFPFSIGLNTYVI